MAKQKSSFGALVNSRNEILTIQRSRIVKHPELWGLPGGRVDEGEGILWALQRELREEIGVEVDPWKHGHLTLRCGWRWHITFLPWTPSPEQEREMTLLVNGKMMSDEVMAAKWRSPINIQHISNLSGLHKSLEIVRLRLDQIGNCLFELLVTDMNVLEV